MNANPIAPDWLAQLSPDHPPPPPGWWPPAPGWWIVLAVLIVALTGYVVWLRNPHRTLRRAALRELTIIATQKANTASTARAIQNILRRYAIAVFGVEQTGRLTGDAWLAFVMTQSAGRLDADSAHSLLSAAFGTPDRDDRDRWLSAATRFVKRGPRLVKAKPRRPAFSPRTSWLAFRPWPLRRRSVR